MEINFVVLLLAALIPMVVGFLYYSPFLFANAWMKEAGLTEDQLKGAKMPVLLVLCFLMSFFLAFSVQFMVIHQYGLFGMLQGVQGMDDPNSAIRKTVDTLLSVHGKNFRYFGHGALHGFMSALFTALPIIAINALFERKSWRYIWIHFGYWAIVLTLMGGVICQFA